MKSKLRKCKACTVYTLEDSCPRCGGQTVGPIPARYSPEDSYGKYRRKIKMETRIAESGPALMSGDSPERTGD